MTEQAEKVAALLKIQEVTVVGILLVILIVGAVAFMRGWLVTGSHHSDTLKTYRECLADVERCRARVEEFETRLARHEERESLGWHPEDREKPT